MKKLLLTLLCVGGILGLPGCGGCCRQACEAPCERGANANDCYEEVMEDGSVRKVCSNGEEVTVYENLRAHDMQQGKKKTNYQTKSRPIHPEAVHGRPMKYVDPIIEEQITYEAAPAKKSNRSKPMRKEIIEDDMMMEEMA